MTRVLDDSLRFAQVMAREAGILAREIRAVLSGGPVTKTDLSPVTVADFVLQALISCRLETVFPGDGFVAEESSEELRIHGETFEMVISFLLKAGLADATRDTVCTWIDRGAGPASGRYWVLDPIDGTKGYIRGGQYAVAVALIENGVVEVAALACPNLRPDLRVDSLGSGVVAWACRGNGSYLSSLNGTEPVRRLRVSGCTDTAQARVLRSYEDSHTNALQTEEIIRRWGNTETPIRVDSQAKFTILAGGEGDILLRLLSPEQPHYREKVWDVAAGSLVTEEAGGKVTDMDGRPLDFTAGRKLLHNRGIVATNRRLHDSVMRAIGDLGI